MITYIVYIIVMSIVVMPLMDKQEKLWKRLLQSAGLFVIACLVWPLLF